MGQLTTPELQAVLYSRLAGSFLSLFGCFFIIGTIIFWGGYRTLPNRLILFLSICTIITSISNSISLYYREYNNQDTIDGSPICTFQGVIMQFSQLASFLWSTIIAFNLWLMVWCSKKEDSIVPVWEKIYHLVAWGLAVVFTVAPLRGYGIAGAWCWIKSSSAPERFGTFYIPLYIMMASVVLFYGLIIYRAKQASKNSHHKRKPRKIFYKLAAYPIVFLLIWIFPTINRIQNWVQPDEEIYALFLLQGFTAPLQGFVNAFIFGFDRESKIRWKRLLAVLLIRFFPKNETLESWLQQSSRYSTTINLTRTTRGDPHPKVEASSVSKEENNIDTRDETVNSEAVDDRRLTISASDALELP